MTNNITDKIKNADRVHRANTLILQAIDNTSDRSLIAQLVDASQVLSDVHKACLSSLSGGGNTSDISN